MAASVQHQSEFDLSSDTSVSCRMVWRVRHDRQELERLGSRISAIILKTELGSGAIEGMQALKQALDPQNIFNPGMILPAVQGLYSQIIRLANRGLLCLQIPGRGDVVVQEGQTQGNLGRGNPVADWRYRSGAQDTRNLPFRRR